MEAKHTATPWEAFTEPEFSGWWAIRQKTEDGLNHEVGSGDGGLEEEDAKFIVRAVNSHDALMTALRKLEVAANTAQHCYDFKPANFAFAMSDLAEAAEEARAALALAGEKP